MVTLTQFQARSTRNSWVNKKDFRNNGDIMVRTCDNLPLELAISSDGIPFKRAKFCHSGSDYSDYSYSDNEANVVSLEKWVSRGPQVFHAEIWDAYRIAHQSCYKIFLGIY